MAAFRIQPLMPAGAYETYKAVMPLASHWRPASCAEVNCAQWLHGWRTVVDESADLGQRQAAWIRQDRSRKHTETRTAAGLTEFTFEAGQRCFAGTQHRVPLDRPATFLVTGGDWRGNPRGTPPRIHASGEDWADDLANHLDRIQDEIRKG